MHLVRCSPRCVPPPRSLPPDRRSTRHSDPSDRPVRSTLLTTLTAVSDPLIAVFAEGLDLDPAVLSNDTSPDNTKEWDSLAAITLTSLIEDEFDVRLGARDIMKMQTIGLARSVLQSKGVSGI